MKIRCKSKKKIVILGAGLSGLSAAFQLEILGLKENYILYEKEKIVGGLCRTKKVNDYLFDYGGHYLHFKNKIIHRWVKKILKPRKLKKFKRQAFIYFKNKFIPYPFQANLWCLSRGDREKCISALLNQPRKINIKNFKEWSLSVFGKGICRFFLWPYNRKLWKTNLIDLSVDCVGRFLPKVSIKDMSQASERKNKKDFGYNSYFYYPDSDSGIGLIASHLKKNIKSIKFDYDIKFIDLKSRIIYFHNHRNQKFDFLISTIPLPILLSKIENLPKRIKDAVQTLKFVSVSILNCIVKNKKNGDVFLNKHWAYLPEAKTPFFRIGFFSNILRKSAPMNFINLSLEVSYLPNEKLDKKKIYLDAQKLLKDMKIINQDSDIIFYHLVDIKYAYIIQDLKYKISVPVIRNYLNGNNIFLAGRYGNWEYSSMADAIEGGMSNSIQIANLLRC